MLGLVLGLALTGVALGVVALLARNDGPEARLPDPGPYPVVSSITPAPDVEGTPLPDLTLERFDGTPMTFDEYQGRPMVVNVWASTCAPCVKEMPAFEAAHQRLGDAVAFVGVNNQDAAARADEFATKTGVTYDLVRDPAGEFFAEMGLVVMPTTLLVAPDGTVVHTKVGELDEADLLELIGSELGVTA